MIKVSGTLTYLIEIHGAVAYMPLNKYTQWASLGPGGRFYVVRGAAGGISISSKRVTVLAQKIMYFNTTTQSFID